VIIRNEADSSTPNVTFDCSSASLICGDQDFPKSPDGGVDWTTQWVYNALADQWHLTAFENFSDVRKVGLRSNNQLTGDNDFYGVVQTFAALTAQDDLNVRDDMSFCDTWGAIGNDVTPDLSDGSCWDADDNTSAYFGLDGIGAGGMKFIKASTDGISLDCAGGSSKLLCGGVDIPMNTDDVAVFFGSQNNEDVLVGHYDDSIDMNLAHYALTSEVAAGYVPLDGSVAMTGGLEIETGGVSIEDGSGNATLLDYDADSFNIRSHATRSINIGYQSNPSGTAVNTVNIGSYAGYGLVAQDYSVNIGSNAGRAGSAFSVYIGDNAGRYNAVGSNVVIGRLAGSDASAAYINSTLVGHGAGQNLEDGANNLCFGYASCQDVTSGDDNILFFGGINVNTGNRNLLLGRDSYTDATTMNDSVGLGFRSGRYQVGSGNVSIGTYTFAGVSGQSAGTYGVAIGDHAGYYHEGSSVLLLGAYAGYGASGTTDADRVVFIGPSAGRHQTSTDDLFILDNRDQGSAAAELTDALMVGTFNADPTLQTLDFNAAVTVSEKLTVEADGTGTFGTYDAEIGSANHAAIRLGSGGIYSSSFVSGNIDLGNTMVFRQEQAVDGILEFAWMESGNTIRAGIPESGAGNAANFIRSFMVAGPYSAATGDNHFICDTHTAYNGNIDCDTASTGADFFVQDDLEVEGTIFAHETINFEGSTADGNHVILAVDDPAADVTHTFPAATGRLANDDRKCVYVKTGLTTGLQLESVWPAHKNHTITGIWCETDAGTAGMDFNIDDGTPAGVNGSDVSCSTTPTWDQVLAGDVDLDQGDRLDLDIGTVATATRLTACFDIALDS
jgi:hypothetical protein